MDHEELIDRLGSWGRSPVPDETRARTLSAMSGRLVSERRWSRPVIAVAALIGFFVGSLGLASAGALPASVQDVAHDMLDHVGVDVPVGTERFNDPTVCPGGPYKNHGQYVKQNKDTDPNAAQSDCGKPLVSTQHDDSSNSDKSDDESESTESEDESTENGKSEDQQDESTNSDHSSAADENGNKDHEKKSDDTDSDDESETESSSSTGS